jgi:hypothetical protein
LGSLFTCCKNRCFSKQDPEEDDDNDSNVGIEMADGPPKASLQRLRTRKPSVSFEPPAVEPKRMRPVRWEIKEGVYGNLLLTGIFTDTDEEIRMFYDNAMQQVVTAEGFPVLNAVGPTNELIYDYLAEVSRKGTPKTERIRSQVVLADFPHIRLFGKKWINEKDGREIRGLKAPFGSAECPSMPTPSTLRTAPEVPRHQNSSL